MANNDQQQVPQSTTEMVKTPEQQTIDRNAQEAMQSSEAQAALRTVDQQAAQQSQAAAGRDELKPEYNLRLWMTQLRAKTGAL